MLSEFELWLDDYLWLVNVVKREQGFKTDEEAEQWIEDNLSGDKENKE